MQEVTVVIPNYNGIKFIKDCLDSLEQQNEKDFTILVVDNGSTDGSLELIQREYPKVICMPLEKNYGFCYAVNVGIQATKTKFVLLLNNDTIVDVNFVGELVEAMHKNPKAFSCAAKMIQQHDKSKIDDAGNYYCALGWAFARGKDKPSTKYNRSTRIFSSCAGAGIYKREVFEEIGYFDETHFAYLEDMDVGYRSRIYGYINYYIPSAIVYHAGSATSGSRYNEFKISHSARNNIYLIYKNMPWIQILINLPFLVIGILIKAVFFGIRGYGMEYLRGTKHGFSLSYKNRKQKIRFKSKNFMNYVGIQFELWVNIIRKALDF